MGPHGLGVRKIMNSNALVTGAVFFLTGASEPKLIRVRVPAQDLSHLVTGPQRTAHRDAGRNRG